MTEQASQITIISDLLKRDPAYKEIIDRLEERLYNRYMVYLSDKPRFNSKTQVIPKQHLGLILSFKNTLELNRVAKKYGLSQEQRDKIPEILWKVFYREAEIKNLPQMLNSELAMNNIRTAYLAAADIANIYSPISDYLGDVQMIVKRWQYEIPQDAESRIKNQESRVASLATIEGAKPAQPQPGSPIQRAQLTIPPSSHQLPNIGSTMTPPPIRPLQQIRPEIIPEGTEDGPILKVQETIARLPRQNQESIHYGGNNQEQTQTQVAPPQTAPIYPQKITPWEAHHETIAQTQKSDLEPEYLLDEPKISISAQPPKPTNPTNVIDLKNF